MIKTKSEEDIRAVFAEKQDVNKVISQQFSNAFNSYSQAINKRFGRTGKLFELPFRRKKIKSEQQLIKSVLHINKNPAKHHVTEDFLNYPYSSVADILSSTALTAEYHEVIALFNGVENFKKSLSEFQT
ncbi:hypothetical protein [Kaistella palustris]|uniref:hypothetical protein n=1 Tax=Kaistella palustris TaxID=493376 RepID=UPI0012EC380E|nr:hypothetical protein [Kaistella palustris]